MSTITFFVSGHPRPGGSKKAFLRYGRNGQPILKDGRPIIGVTDMGGEKTKNWRALVAHEARIAYRGDPLDCAVEVTMTFVMPRPKYHSKSNGTLKPSAPVWHTSMPDCTKLIRSTEDALTGIIWRDDSIIVRQHASKRYGTRPGVQIEVRAIFVDAEQVPQELSFQ